jgi:hypothetical protein
MVRFQKRLWVLLDVLIANMSAAWWFRQGAFISLAEQQLMRLLWTPLGLAGGF